MPSNRFQGEVWWANLPDPVGWRPVVILTRNSAIPVLHSVTVAPLTRTLRNVPTEVVVDVDDGVPTRSAVSLDNIATIEKDRLVQQITTLGTDRMNEIWEALHIAFDLPW